MWIRKRIVLVKWVGNDNKHNSWIPKSDIQNMAEAFDDLKMGDVGENPSMKTWIVMN